MRRRFTFNVEDYEGDEVLKCIVSVEIEKADGLIENFNIYKDEWKSVRLMAMAA